MRKGRTEVQKQGSDFVDIDREKYAFFKKKIIEVAGDVYLMRWVLARTPLIQAMLHKFLRGDEDRCLHDHPWPFITFILTNGYYEVTPEGTFFRKPLRFYYRPAEWKHRVVLKESPTWTIVVTGPKKRTWGFWTKSGWQHWRHFLVAKDKGMEAC